VRLSANAEAGSEINIVADQVKINDINFVSNGGSTTNNTGYVESDGYTAGSTGWRISGTGDAEFGNVVVRGSLQTSNIDGDLTINTGAILAGNTSSAPQFGKLMTLYHDESTFPYTIIVNRTATEPGRTVLLLQSADGGDASYIADLQGGPSARIRIDTLCNFVSNGKITTTEATDSSNVASGSIVTSGGVGIAKNAYVGANLRVLGTTEATSTNTGSTVLSGGLGIAKNIHVGGVVVAPKELVKMIEGFDSPYTVLSNDITLLVDTSASAVTINLPVGIEGRKLTVKHIIGTASSESVTINRASTDTIEGNTSYTINTDKGCVSLVFYSGVWYILSEIT
jgi:hypothetical protein